jgi:murein DD-endopeptidase MepM/ murein hydrolase activator NlpD
VIRSVALTAFGALALAGCASIDYEPVATAAASPAPPPAPAPAPTIDPAIYMNAPRAPLMSQLFVCSTSASNIGPISETLASLAYTPYIATAAGALLRDPTEGACLSSGFGWRNRGENGSNHTGIDLANPNGGFIFAAADGVVEYTGWEGGYGIVIQLDHGRGVHTLYGHLSDVNPSLSQGSFVRGGAAIGRMGMTGDATGVHLHYEVTIDGLKVDPLNYGAPQVTQVNQSHNSPIDVSPQPQPRPAATVEISHKPDEGAPGASVIETPSSPASSPSAPSQPVSSQPVSSQPVSSQPVSSQPVSSQPASSPPPGALPAPPQPPATEPLQVSPDSDGWTPGKSR